MAVYLYAVIFILNIAKHAQNIRNRKSNEFVNFVSRDLIDLLLDMIQQFIDLLHKPIRNSKLIFCKTATETISFSTS